MTRKFLITEEQVFTIGNYLITKPYIEVKDFVPILTSLTEIKDTVEETKPE